MLSNNPVDPHRLRIHSQVLRQDFHDPFFSFRLLNDLTPPIYDPIHQFDRSRHALLFDLPCHIRCVLVCYGPPYSFAP